ALVRCGLFQRLVGLKQRRQRVLHVALIGAGGLGGSAERAQRSKAGGGGDREIAAREVCFKHGLFLSDWMKMEGRSKGRVLREHLLAGALSLQTASGTNTDWLCRYKAPR